MNNSRQHRSWILGICGRAAFSALALTIMLAPVILATGSAQAQTFTTLHSFDYTDGEWPFGALVQATDGNFYGTTASGGANAFAGTVFKITPSGAVTTLYSFCSKSGCADGWQPLGGLLLVANGDFYGTTAFGGSSSCSANGAGGCGTVFVLAGSNLTTLHDFAGYPTDGAVPKNGPLIQATDGNLYGTTEEGGSSKCAEYGCGTVFEITTGGALTTIYNFCENTGCGYYPDGVIQATDGNFYGTTFGGGANGNTGTIFQLSKQNGSWTLTTLHSFDGSDGLYPGAALIQADDGSFYGTTAYGGAYGYGTVFKFSQQNGVWTLNTLYSFAGYPNDGGGPEGLVQATDGNFYGTTFSGGASSACNNEGIIGCGTVFKITPKGTFTILHSFDGADGSYPEASLVQATSGNFYGTTEEGGASGNCSGGCGTVFSLSVTVTKTTTTLTSSPNPSTYGEAVTFTAVVTPAPPNGETVSFMKGKTVLGTGTLSSGTATFVTSTLKVGKTSVTAVYAGDSDFKASKSKPVKQVVEKAEE